MMAPHNLNSKRPRQEGGEIPPESESEQTKRRKLDSGNPGGEKPTPLLFTGSTREPGHEDCDDTAPPEGQNNDDALGRGAPAGKGRSRKGKERDRRSAGRLRHRRTSRNDEALSGCIEGRVETGNLDESASKAPRLPKKQCALLIGFCGTGCNGMQIQPDVRTIEGVLFNALVKAGAVSQDNADNPTKVNLGRAARTDAGVHAAGNVVSIKMITTVPGIPDMVSRINEELPPEIRLWGYVRVQNSFNARLSCDSRKYTYLLPTYLLIPPKPGSGLDRTLQNSAASSPRGQFVFNNSTHPFWANGDVVFSTREDDLIRKRQWRVTSDQMRLLRETAKKFEGTHNFHNFTVGRDFGDRSNQRHIKKMEVSDPAVHGNTEWISVMFHGQSFMLHQRKMMCVLILTCRTSTPQQIIDELYGPRTVFVPKMPSLGLLLERPIFDSYNTKVSIINEKVEPSHPDYRPIIDFEPYRETIEEFKQVHIYEQMRTIEDRDAIFDAWIRSVDSYAGNDLLYLNAKGVIPVAAVIKKGERREKPFREKRRFDAAGFPGHAGGKTVYQEEEDEEEEEETSLNKEELADMEG